MKNNNRVLLALALGAVVLTSFYFLQNHRGSEGKFDRSTLMKNELNISSDAELDYENVNHLVFLYEHASKRDKQFARSSIEVARELMTKENRSFARVEFEDAILSYPTPDLVLEFANGFLRTAQNYYDIEKPNIDLPMGNNDLKWYLLGSKFYFNLAVEFSSEIDVLFSREKVGKIHATTDCIDTLLDGSAQVLCDPIEISRL